jgi:hypothetical protein
MYNGFVRLLKEHQSSSQHHLKIVIVLRAHTMSNTPIGMNGALLFWKFDEIDVIYVNFCPGLYIIVF